MITIRNKCDYDNELLIMTSESTYLEDKLEFFMRFLIATGHAFELEAELCIVEKDEMVWTDAEIAQLKKETIEDYIEDQKEDMIIVPSPETNLGTFIIHDYGKINNEDELIQAKDNYMDEAPF